jgi:hypothetical protein
VTLTRSLWLWLTVALAAAVTVFVLTAQRDSAPAASPHAAAPARPFVGIRLTSAQVPGAAATLARRAPAFGAGTKRALKRSDRAITRDAAAAQSALTAWATSDSDSPDGVIAAISRLRADLGSLRRTIAKLKPRAKKDKRARTYLLGSLAQTDKGLRGLNSMLVLNDPQATELLSPQKAFTRADDLAAKASKALGCKRPCSRAL